MLNIITRITLFLMVLFLSTISTAQNKLDAYFDHLFENQKFMGSVAISFQDSIIYSRSVGYSDVEEKTLIDQNTKFRIGSISKTYTAVLVLKAIEEGKLDLNNTLDKWFAQFPNASKITIEQMLKHRSGIFNISDVSEEGEWEQTFHTHNQVIDFVKDQPSVFEPDTNYEYSNTNYILLGYILEKIYKKDFATLLKEKITEPLGLKNTYFSFETDTSKNETYSYNIQKEYIRNAKVNYSNHPASGGILSTPIEVNKFVGALFEGRIINEKSLELMLPIVKGTYGMGIELLGFSDLDVYEHSGRIENFFSDYWYFPKEKLGVATTSNATNIYIGPIQMALVRYAYGNMPNLPDFNHVEGLTKEEFQEIRGTYYNSENDYTVTISSNGDYLFFQDSRAGQMYLNFDYLNNNVFVNEEAEIELQFFSKKGELVQKQSGANIVFKKQN